MLQLRLYLVLSVLNWDGVGGIGINLHSKGKVLKFFLIEFPVTH